MDPEEKARRMRRPAARRAKANAVEPHTGAGDASDSTTPTGAAKTPAPAKRPGSRARARGEKKVAAKARSGRAKDVAPRRPTDTAADSRWQPAAKRGEAARPSGRAKTASALPTPPAGPPVPSPSHAPDAAQPVEPSNVQAHLYEIQQNLDRLLRDVHRASGDPASRKRAADALNKIASQLGAEGAQAMPDGQAGNLLRSLSADQLVRRLSRVAMKNRADEVDEFGLDRTYEAHVRPTLKSLYTKYFRTQAEGLENIPASGRALLVCNRGGALPLDGLMLKVAVDEMDDTRRELRWLIEDFNFHAPFLGPFLNRIGAVRACQENAERLLEQEALVAVFPEGIKGVSKLYSKRYQLQRFGRGGYIKLALRTGTPIIPVAVVGPEDAYPVLYRLSSLAKGLGLPFLPLTPTFPWLGPAGLLPLPSRFVIKVGEAIEGMDAYEPSDADDAMVVNELNERVRGRIQELLSEAQTLRGDHVYA